MEKPEPKQNPANFSQKDVKQSKFYALTKRDGQRAIALNLIFPDGRQKAFMYAYISAFEFNPSTGIEIETTENKITIKGRNLESLYNRLLRHKVRWIKLFLNEHDDETPENECFISHIEIN